MKYYLDITLLPDEGANLAFLWQKVFQQIHIALVENKIAKNQSEIAVSFPGYGNKNFPLGEKIRLFAESEKLLEQLNIEKWLFRLTDYVHIKPIKPVPNSVSQYASFWRKQFKSNLMKEAARRAKYKNETLGEALAYFESYDKESTLPYINLTSLSMDGRNVANRNFKLFIEHRISEERQQGVFNCYGLSKNATVPWF